MHHRPARWESYKRWQANKCVFIQATKMFYLLPSPMTLPFKDTSLSAKFLKNDCKEGQKKLDIPNNAMAFLIIHFHKAHQGE